MPFLHLIPCFWHVCWSLTIFYLGKFTNGLRQNSKITFYIFVLILLFFAPWSLHFLCFFFYLIYIFFSFRFWKLVLTPLQVHWFLPLVLFHLWESPSEAVFILLTVALISSTSFWSVRRTSVSLLTLPISFSCLFHPSEALRYKPQLLHTPCLVISSSRSYPRMVLTIALSLLTVLVLLSVMPCWFIFCWKLFILCQVTGTKISGL